MNKAYTNDSIGFSGMNVVIAIKNSGVKMVGGF